MLLSLSSTFFEKILQQALKNDPALAKKCRDQGDKIVAVNVGENTWTLYFSQGSCTCYSGDSSKKPNLNITGTYTAWMAFLLRHDNTGIALQGDVVMAQILEQCFQRFLSEKTLDILPEAIAYPAKSLLRFGREKLNQHQQKTYNRVADYLQEEAYLVPLAEEVRAFCHEVDALRLRMDRLEKTLCLK